MMKTILGTALLATLMTGAASAATTVHHRAAMQSYAAAPPYEVQGAYVAVDPDTVVSGGQFVGRDPDPSVRLQLLKDADLANY